MEVDKGCNGKATGGENPTDYYAGVSNRDRFELKPLQRGL
jgi:hypothetical protein